ncbi:apolipoprotein A-Ib [Phycodurus eques]|uniref:apolipoprotein A-Ib n=1 Tax=Phycodurus eques TaxID=693459 RepID=UPI002ACD7ABF|nr:apolipoprotein A-Ib [Phycodurus eques]
MKFVALAVTLLLAIGSQAASLQAEAPTPLAHFQAVMDVYLTQIKESVQRTLDQLDDTEYKEFKVLVSTRLDEVETQVKTQLSSFSTITNGVVTTLIELTQQLRDDIQADFNALKTNNGIQNLREVLEKHFAEYQMLFDPVIKDYKAMQSAQIEALINKLEPLKETLQTKVSINAEETKEALIPIVEAVRDKVKARLEDLKDTVKPYVEDYKDQMRQAYDQVKAIKQEDLVALKEKISPQMEDIRDKFQIIVNTIHAALKELGSD